MRKPLVFVALPPRLYGLFFSPELWGGFCGTAFHWKAVTFE